MSTGRRRTCGVAASMVIDIDVSVERMISFPRRFVGEQWCWRVRTSGVPAIFVLPGASRPDRPKSAGEQASLPAPPSVACRCPRQLATWFPGHGQDPGPFLVIRRCAYMSLASAQLDPSSPSTSAALSIQSTPSLLSIVEKLPLPSLRSPMAAPPSSSQMA